MNNLKAFWIALLIIYSRRSSFYALCEMKNSLIDYADYVTIFNCCWVVIYFLTYVLTSLNRFLGKKKINLLYQSCYLWLLISIEEDSKSKSKLVLLNYDSTKLSLNSFGIVFFSLNSSRCLAGSILLNIIKKENGFMLFLFNLNYLYSFSLIIFHFFFEGFYSFFTLTNYATCLEKISKFPPFVYVYYAVCCFLFFYCFVLLWIHMTIEWTFDSFFFSSSHKSSS